MALRSPCFSQAKRLADDYPKLCFFYELKDVTHLLKVFGPGFEIIRNGEAGCLAISAQSWR
jgi:hypothetical protein